MAIRKGTATKYKRTRVLSPTDTAYLAGLIDGEGTISLTRKYRDGNRQPCVSISSTARYILEHVLCTVGAGKITNKRTYSKRHSPAGVYAIANRQALDLLKQVFPFLRSYKSERARLVLEHYLRLTPRNGRYSSEQLKEREFFVKQFLELRPIWRPDFPVGTAALHPSNELPVSEWRLSTHSRHSTVGERVATGEHPQSPIAATASAESFSKSCREKRIDA